MMLTTDLGPHESFSVRILSHCFSFGDKHPQDAEKKLFAGFSW